MPTITLPDGWWPTSFEREDGASIMKTEQGWTWDSDYATGSDDEYYDSPLEAIAALEKAEKNNE